MSFYSGTASNYIDLLKTIIDKMQLNGWTLIECNGNASSPTTADLNLTPTNSTVENRSYLQSTGHSTVDAWQIDLFTYQNSATGMYNIVFRCGVYNVAGDTTWLPSLVGNWQCITCWNNVSNYWININVGRMMITNRIGSAYYFGYCGYFYPFANPSQYIAPLISIGQGANYNTAIYTQDLKSLSRSSTASYSATVMSHVQTNLNGHGNSASVGIVPFRNESNLAIYSGSHPPLKIYGEDAYELFECIVVHSSAERGYLDGVRQVSSVDNTNEAVITDQSGEEWLCFGQHQSISNSQMYAISKENI